MRALAIIFAALAAACGSVHDRAECSASTDCPAGSYCSRTADGNVCWADAVAPSVSGVTVTCPAPCLRDSVLHVEADVTDDAEVLGAEVVVGAAGPVQMARASGGMWAADVNLAEFPFAYFETDLVATVTGSDGARNVTNAFASPVHVTRLRFETELEPGVALTSPAVMADGTVSAAGANHKLYLQAWDGTGLTSLAVGTLQLTAAPLALGTSVWIGSEDNFVYEVTTTAPGSWQSTVRTSNTGGPIRGSLSLTADNRVVAVSQSGFVFAVTSSGYLNSTPGFATSFGSVVESGSIYLVSSGALRRFDVISGAPTVDALFAVTIGSSVNVPLAADGALLVASNNGSQGQLKRVLTAGGTPEQIATTGVPSGGVAVLADGDILVPEETRTVTRWTSAGAVVGSWTTPDLGGAARTPLVLDSPTAPFIVTTDAGTIHALRPDGTSAWNHQFAAGLQPANIYTPPGQIGQVLSTAYVAGADGRLRGVIVDGALDGTAPWPKAFHDPRNTNRAGPQP
jgi:hypothetical protein